MPVSERRRISFLVLCRVYDLLQMYRGEDMREERGC